MNRVASLGAVLALAAVGFFYFQTSAKVEKSNPQTSEVANVQTDVGSCCASMAKTESCCADSAALVSTKGTACSGSCCSATTVSIGEVAADCCASKDTATVAKTGECPACPGDHGAVAVTTGEAKTCPCQAAAVAQKVCTGDCAEKCCQDVKTTEVVTEKVVAEKSEGDQK